MNVSALLVVEGSLANFPSTERYSPGASLPFPPPGPGMSKKTESVWDASTHKQGMCPYLPLNKISSNRACPGVSEITSVTGKFLSAAFIGTFPSTNCLEMETLQTARGPLRRWKHSKNFVTYRVIASAAERESDWFAQLITNHSHCRHLGSRPRVRATAPTIRKTDRSRCTRKIEPLALRRLLDLLVSFALESNVFSTTAN